MMLLHPYLAACKIGVPGVSFSTYPGPGRGVGGLLGLSACIAQSCCAGTPMHLYEIPEEDRQAGPSQPEPPSPRAPEPEPEPEPEHVRRQSTRTWRSIQACRRQEAPAKWQL